MYHRSQLFACGAALITPPSLLGKDVFATQRYTSSNEPPQLRIRYSRRHVTAANPKPESLGTRELVLSHSVFTDAQCGGMYERLRDELLAVPTEAVPTESFIKPLHKDPKLDKLEAPPAHIGTAIRRWDLFAPHCPTLVSVTSQLATFFGVQAATNRLNWFRQASDHKPFHHDAHAFDFGEGMYQGGDATYNGLYKGKVANCTVVASFGAERWYSVQDRVRCDPGGTVAIHVPNGSVVAMGRDANIMWRHGVPPGSPAKVTLAGRASRGEEKKSHVYEEPGEGRMSIVVTGWVDQVAEKGWGV